MPRGELARGERRFRLCVGGWKLTIMHRRVGFGSGNGESAALHAVKALELFGRSDFCRS